MGALIAHQNFVPAMGPECKGAVRNATACVRRIGCTTECCSTPEAAMLPEGVRHVMEKAEAHGGPLRVLGGHGTGEGCTTHVVCIACVVHPFARCIVQVGRAVHLFDSRCGLRRAGRAG
jgi:hypothetical protein